MVLITLKKGLLILILLILITLFLLNSMELINDALKQGIAPAVVLAIYLIIVNLNMTELRKK